MCVYYHCKMKPRRIPLFHSVQLVLVDIAFEALVAACDPLLASPQAYVYSSQEDDSHRRKNKLCKILFQNPSVLLQPESFKGNVIKKERWFYRTQHITNYWFTPRKSRIQVAVVLWQFKTNKSQWIASEAIRDSTKLVSYNYQMDGDWAGRLN